MAPDRAPSAQAKGCGMKYRSAAAFRQALEERLRGQSLSGSESLARLRKLVAFERLLARLEHRWPTALLLKGGLALQLRIGKRARTTKDVDMAASQPWGAGKASEQLRATAGVELGDWFAFEIGEPEEAATGAPGRGFRFPVQCLLDGRPFEFFHVDMGFGDAVVDPPEKVRVPSLLAFAGVAPTTVRCYPLTAHLAEKLHAYTREYSGPGDHASSRFSGHSSNGILRGFPPFPLAQRPASHLSSPRHAGPARGSAFAPGGACRCLQKAGPRYAACLARSA